MSRVQRPFAAALLAALVLALGSLRAAERVTLRWKAPAECPGESDVKAEVDRLLGASRARPAKPIEVSAAVSRDDRGTWHVRLETPGDGATHVREIHGASCRALANASALILAMMIDPEAAASAPAPSSSASASAPATSGSAAPSGSTTPISASGAPSGSTTPISASGAPTSGSGAPTSGSGAPTSGSGAPTSGSGALTSGSTTPISGSSAAISGSSAAISGSSAAISGSPAATSGSGALVTAPGAPLRATASPATPKNNRPPGSGAPPPEIHMLLPISFRVGAWAGADAGSLPGVSAGFGVTAALLIGAQRIEIGFAARPPATATLAERPTSGGTVDLISGSLGTCRAFLERPIELGPCVWAEAGRMHAAGFGVTAPGRADEPWLALGAGGLLAWRPVQRLALVLRLDAVVPLLRPTFVLDGAGPVHHPGAVAGRAAGGVEIAF